MSDRLKERKVSPCALVEEESVSPTGHLAGSMTKMCHTGLEVWRNSSGLKRGQRERTIEEMLALDGWWPPPQSPGTWLGGVAGMCT